MTATTISKRPNANLDIKISKHTISRRRNEINLNSQVASTKTYISKKSKIRRWKFPNGTGFISAMSQSLTCSKVTVEGSFDAVLRNDILLNALKAALNLEEEVWWCLAWFAITGRLVRQHGKINATVYKEILKLDIRLYLIWEQ